MSHITAKYDLFVKEHYYTSHTKATTKIQNGSRICKDTATKLKSKCKMHSVSSN